ncbi:hypothetical protein WJX73_009386 [Symbiochloris irregularis]|uniref:1,3-beta-glucan synthase component FKS1-like domain-containing protein n=1 Tax=Symbiochloris irregularis TaxID=706552 RepID=A0AAW1NS70_9CHLO
MAGPSQRLPAPLASSSAPIAVAPLAPAASLSSPCAASELQRNRIYQVVHRLCQYYGFQSFHASEQGGISRATRFLVTDHLHQLIVEDESRRQQPTTTAIDDTFEKAVLMVHSKVFAPFREWAKHVGLALSDAIVVRRPGMALLGPSNPLERGPLFLEDLALYFCIWTEAANARHLPEGLWWLFWILSRDLLTPATQPRPSSPKSTYASDWEAAKLRPEAFLSAQALQQSTRFTCKVIQPIFTFLAAEVPTNVRRHPDDERGCDTAHRVHYDDVNESFCRRRVVLAAIEAMGIQVHKDGGHTLLAGGCNSCYESLCFWAQQRDWYANHICCKTFVEHRSLLQIFRAFFRLFSFIILLFQGLAIWNWNGTIPPATTVVLTHAGLVLFNSFSTMYLHFRAFLQPTRPTSDSSVYSSDSKQYTGGHQQPAGKLQGGGSMGRHTSVPVGARGSFLRAAALTLASVALNALLWTLYVGEFLDDYAGVAWLQWRGLGWKPRALRGSSVDYLSPYYLAILTYTSIVLLHFVLTLRPGYVTGIIPTSKRVGVLRHRAAEYLQPAENLRVPWPQFLQNVAFWTLALGSKAVFDYFALILPLRDPVRLLAQYNAPWGYFLAVFRVSPNFIAACFDTSLFFTIYAALFGLVKGYLQLNLGFLVNFEDVRSNFHQAPRHYAKVMRPLKSTTKHAGAGLSSVRTLPRNFSAMLSNVRGVFLNQPSAAAFVNLKSLDSQGLSTVAEESSRHGSLPLSSKSAQSGFTEDLELGGQSETSFLRNRIWGQFSEAWHEIVSDLRNSDCLSDQEVRALQFLDLRADRPGTHNINSFIKKKEAKDLPGLYEG